MINEVFIDSDLEEVIPGFLKNREQDLLVLKGDLLKGDYKSVEFMGHSLKGVGSGYGFEEISRLGKAIEALAKTENLDKIMVTILELEAYIKGLKITYIDVD